MLQRKHVAVAMLSALASMPSESRIAAVAAKCGISVANVRKLAKEIFEARALAIAEFAL